MDTICMWMNGLLVWLCVWPWLMIISSVHRGGVTICRHESCSLPSSCDTYSGQRKHCKHHSNGQKWCTPWSWWWWHDSCMRIRHFSSSRIMLHFFLYSKASICLPFPSELVKFSTYVLFACSMEKFFSTCFGDNIFLFWNHERCSFGNGKVGKLEQFAQETKDGGEQKEFANKVLLKRRRRKSSIIHRKSTWKIAQTFPFFLPLLDPDQLIRDWWRNMSTPFTFLLLHGTGTFLIPSDN